MQPGAAHFPWLDDPEHFVREIVAFLEADRAVGADPAARPAPVSGWGRTPS
ncbi:hypothetical protein ACWERI_23845 [Streptomyces collinus]